MIGKSHLKVMQESINLVAKGMIDRSVSLTLQWSQAIINYDVLKNFSGIGD